MDWEALFASANGPPELATLRSAAGARFLELGLPSPRDDGWRYTDTRVFAKQELELMRPAIEIDAPAGVRVRPLGEAVDAAQPFLADETDSGLDIDALRVVASGINSLRRDDNATIVVTHYQRLLNYVVPDFVHILVDGHIVRSGDRQLALDLEKQGYDRVAAQAA